MQFNNITIENFMAIGQATINLNTRGLLLIQGRNKDDTSQDSNGAGKSSIADAISWCLYGKTARDVAGDSIVNRTAGKDTRVRVEIMVSTDEFYIVTRHRKHKEYKNAVRVEQHSKGSMPIDLTKGTDKLTQELVDKIIGSSADVFRAAIYSGQEGQIDLPGLTDKFLKTIVEEAAGVDKLQAAHEIAKKRVNEISKDITSAQAKLENVNLGITNDGDLLSSYQEAAVEFEAQRKLKISGLSNKIESNVTALKAKIHDYKSLDRSRTLERIAELEATLKGVESEHEQLAELRKEAQSLETTAQIQRSAIESKANEAKQVKIQLDDVQSLVGKPCTECGKEHTEADMDATVCAMEEKYKNIALSATGLKPAYLALKEDLVKASERANTFESSMTDVSATMTDLDVFRSDLKASDEVYQSITSDKQEVEAMKQRLESVKTEANTQEVLAKDCEKRIEQARVSALVLDKDIRALDRELKVRKGVAKTFGPAGVRAHILDTVTPQLNDRTASYLNTLSDGNLSAQWSTLKTNSAGEIRESFNILINSKTGGSSFKELSGGEKRKVRLATNLALQDLVSSRATKPIDLFIGDEIDNALDTSGLERLMALLEERAKIRGTVLIVSHNDLGDWVRQQMTITKEDGYSTIEDCL